MFFFLASLKTSVQTKTWTKLSFFSSVLCFKIIFLKNFFFFFLFRLPSSIFQFPGQGSDQNAQPTNPVVPRQELLLKNPLKVCGNLTAEKPGKHHQTQVIKVNITSNGTDRHRGPPNVRHRKVLNVTYVIFLPKNAQPEFNWRKTRHI